MASSKRIGFFWGEEKITVVEFDQNAPVLIASTPWASKNVTLSPFSSNLTEEIQITAVLQKLLRDNRISGSPFFVSLPMKDIVLRSFIIPMLKPEEIQGAIKFEAKKYIPFDIQELAYVFYTTPVVEDKVKRLQVIFFAVRKEVLAKYGNIFTQVNSKVTFCEPYLVSLVKTLLFNKEIKPTDHFAFLVLENNIGRICFIDKGIPQFIREFSIAPATIVEEIDDNAETMNSKIINEVGNSFDFYARQFNADKIDKMFVSSDFAQQDLLSFLESELKVNLIRFTSSIAVGSIAQNYDMDAVCAMGACIAPQIDSLAEFNFLEDKTNRSKLKKEFLALFKTYREVVLIALGCGSLLVGAFVFLQAEMKVVQKQYDILSSNEGASSSEAVTDIQADSQQSTDMLNKYQSIRRKSDLVFILMRVASRLPPGVLLGQLQVKYNQDSTPSDIHMNLFMQGVVITDDPNGQIAIVNKVFSDFKNDKELARFIKSVKLDSLNRQEARGRQATGFTINCE